MDTPAENGTTTALVKVEREYQGLQMATAPAEAQRRVQELQAFVQKAMVKGLDYDTIPGTEKPSLLQPGAQKLAEIYGFSHRFIVTEQVKEWERGFFYFEYRCVLESRRDGSFVGEGLGSCNSRESKYAGRWVPASELPKGANLASYQRREGARWCFETDLPAGVDRRTLQTQQRKSKKGSTYTVYRVVDEQYLVPNPDPYSLVNTMQKMAAKRAYVMAVIAATRSAGIFTQDTEDLPAEVFGKAETARSWEGDAKEQTPAPGRVEPAPTGQALVDTLTTLLERVTTLEDLKLAWGQVNAQKKRGQLDDAQAAQLEQLKNARKLAIEQAPPPPPDENKDWGMEDGGREPGVD